MKARYVNGQQLKLVGQTIANIEIHGKVLKILFYLTEEICGDHAIIGSEWIQKNFKYFIEVTQRTDEWQQNKRIKAVTVTEQKEDQIKGKSNYNEVFSDKIDKNKCCNIIKHQILTKNDTKRINKTYYIPYH